MVDLVLTCCCVRRSSLVEHAVQSIHLPRLKLEHAPRRQCTKQSHDAVTEGRGESTEHLPAIKEATTKRLSYTLRLIGLAGRVWIARADDVNRRIDLLSGT